MLNLISYQDFDNGANVCVKCDPSCLTCNGLGPNKCLTCSSTNFRILSGTSCQCKKLIKIFKLLIKLK
jgi:hypothetical protein